jgi:transcriptional regulator with XRE-family HTH domain
MSTETERINIAENVRRLRRLQGLTQMALAERSGLCQSWISRLERRAENPSIATLQRLATGLRVRVPDLLDGGGAGASAP